MNLAEIRREYARAMLDVPHVDADPFAQFARWINEAITAEASEATAMALATVSPDGRPSCRVVLLKGHDRRGLAFYTSYRSRKGNEIAANARVAATFYWSELERQLRVEGTAEPLSEATSDAYFASRPSGARLSAVASPQSAVVPDRAALERAYSDAAARYGDDVARPPHWGGYRIVPDRFEFWQGRANRLHDRLLYLPCTDGAWTISRLAP